MSDHVYSDRRSRTTIPNTIESRAMFGAFYLLFLLRAVVHRVLPWHPPHPFGRRGRRESIFREASNAASVSVTSSFMGL